MCSKNMSENIKDIKQQNDIVSEPVATAVVDYGCTVPFEDDLSRVPYGQYGFYTEDPVEFKKRVDSFEASLDEVDEGKDDPQTWIQVDDFMAAMRKEHPWL